MARIYLKDRQPVQQQSQVGTIKQPTQLTGKRIYLKDRGIQQRPDIRQSDAYKNAVAGAEQAKKESDYANSFRGLATNTAKAAGSTILNFGKEVARMPLTVPLKAIQSLTEAATKKPQVYTPQTGVEKFFYGDTPRQSYQQDQQGIQKWGQEKGLGRGSSIALGAAGAGAEILADLLPAGVGGKVISKIKSARPFQKGIPAQTTRKYLSQVDNISTQALGKTQKAFPQQVEKVLPQKLAQTNGLKSSYTPNTTTTGKNVNPLIQEARKGEVANWDRVKRQSQGLTDKGKEMTVSNELSRKNVIDEPDYKYLLKRAGASEEEIASGKITVYRATENGKIMPGDYVSPDKSVLKPYFDQRVETGRKPKIVSQKVDIKDLMIGDEPTDFVWNKSQEDRIKLFHQTSPEAAAKIEKEGFRTDLPGSGSTDYLPEGVNTKKTNAELNIQGKGSQLEVSIPKNANIKKFTTRDDAENYFYYHDKGEKYQSLVDEVNRLDKESVVKADEIDKSYSSLKTQAERTANINQQTKILDDYRVKMQQVSKEARAEAMKIAKEEGIDAISIEKDFGGFNRTTDNTIVINKDLLKTNKQLSQPLQEGGKQRGFVTTVKNSPELSQDLASRVEGDYDAIKNKPMQEKAQRLIFDNINEAERTARENIGAEGVITGNELVKHWDSIAINAKKTGDMATFNQALDKASDLVKTQAKNLTEAGQTIQAASTINKMSPEGVLHYVNKIAKDAGTDLKLSNEKTFDFMRQADEIQKILDPRERAFKTFDLIDDITENVPRGGKDKLLEVLNLPRAIMATADLSAPLRQGIFSAARNPVMFAKNFKSMFKYAFSEKAYRNLKADIVTSPNYNLYQKYKLTITDVSAGLTGREEQFMSTLAEKIPLFGKLAKGSNRAYTGFLNKMRVDLFDDFIKTAKLENITDPKFFEDAATFVGSATGRGKLGRFEDAAKLLNTTFFSPRLMASRVNLISPRYYYKLHPAVRKEAFKSLASFVGTGTAVLGLAKLNGAEVGTDPRSADFGKIKIGNTRYDIWGGFQQYARLIGQLTTGEKVSTTTGKETTLGEGYNAPTRESIFMDFLKSKEAPLFSFLTRYAQGEKFGEKFNLPAEVIDRFIPMIASDAFDLAKENGLVKGVGMALPGMFGVGSQTYGDQIPMMTKTAIGNPSVKWRSQPGLGETILNGITGNQVSSIPKEQWKPLVEERTAEQKRQVEVNAAKQNVLNTGQPQLVGDTFIYLENGVVKTKVNGKVQRTPLQNELKKSNLQPFYQ